MRNKAIVCLMISGLLMGLGTAVLPVDARRQKASQAKSGASPGKQDASTAADAQKTDHATVWLTGTGDAETHALKGKLTATLYLDSAVIDLQSFSNGAAGLVGLTEKGVLFRLEDGKQPRTVWSQTPSQSVRNKIAPGMAVTAQSVWVSMESTRPVTQSGSAYVLQSYNLANGQPGPSLSVPCLAMLAALPDEHLLVVLDNGHVQKINPLNGAVVWHTDLKSPVMARPFVRDGFAYVADLQGVCRKIDLANGHTVWEFGTGGSYEATPVLSPAGDTLVAPSAIGTLFGLNAENGQRKWSHTLPEGTPFLSSPVTGVQSVIAADQSGLVFALDRQTNRRLWQQRLSSWMNAPLLMAGPHVLVMLKNGDIKALSTSNGQMAWQAAIKGILSAQPVIVWGKLWLGTSDGRLLCLE